MDSYFCEQHQTKWFKTGKMKTYAHPVKGANGETTGWCNMPDGEVPTVVKEAVKQGAVIVSEKPAGKNRSYALSYAKDIGVAMIAAGKEFSSKKVLEIAKEFNDYLDGE
jgi:hypothetical protein